MIFREDLARDLETFANHTDGMAAAIEQRSTMIALKLCRLSLQGSTMVCSRIFLSFCCLIVKKGGKVYLKTKDELIKSDAELLRLGQAIPYPNEAANLLQACQEQAALYATRKKRAVIDFDTTVAFSAKL